MNVPLSTAAAGAPVVWPVPITTVSPALSRPRTALGGDARPRQLGPDQGAPHAVEKEMLCPVDHILRNIVELQVGDPGGQLAGGPVGIGGGLLLPGGHRVVPSLRSNLTSCYIYITSGSNDASEQVWNH